MTELPPIFFGLDYGRGTPVGITVPDRRRHIHISGATGSGKSTLLLWLLVQDVLQGRGVGLIDPHGTLAERLLECIPPSRIKDVCYFHPADRHRPVGFNPLEVRPGEERHLVAAAFVEACRAIWRESWGARLEHVLRNTVAALLELPNPTMLGIRRMLTDRTYREAVLARIRDPETLAFWREEFPGYGRSLQAEATAPVLNKIAAFLASPRIRPVIGQSVSTIDHRTVMDRGQIFIANLAKGKIGADQAHLIGSLLIAKFAGAAFTRDPKAENRDFALVIDEFQTVATTGTAEILAEARAYNFALVMAHQHPDQLPLPLRTAVLSNAATIIAFQQGPDGADILARTFAGEVAPAALTELDPFRAYIRRTYQNRTLLARRVVTPTHEGLPTYGRSAAIIEQSRQRFGVSRRFIERKVAARLGTRPGTKKPRLLRL